MNGAAETGITVPAGLAAACSFGVGVALQHRQAQLAPVCGREPFRLLAHLTRQRLWLAGITLNVAAYGLLALALALAFGHGKADAMRSMSEVRHAPYVHERHRPDRREFSLAAGGVR